ncbi:hypothetical protein [Winogradskyella sp.]|jgi:hypothetical protein|uniref:hypothetical protein n=1 Tax=Winogradskyella sp. TaxID=1883156 RepID=UPI0025F704AE|nr:hypothetical protein [Winogradskyella sp.]MCT4631062.1 hypothetical protein [Winogradskyella sp.]
MKKFFLIITLVAFNSSFSQITGTWTYKEKGIEYNLKIEEKNNHYFGNLIRLKHEGDTLALNKIFMTDFKKTSSNTYIGTFKLKKNKTTKGRIIQKDKNTLEFQYKWILFYIKDIWKRIK